MGGSLRTTPATLPAINPPTSSRQQGDQDQQDSHSSEPPKSNATGSSTNTMLPAKCDAACPLKVDPSTL